VICHLGTHAVYHHLYIVSYGRSLVFLQYQLNMLLFCAIGSKYCTSMSGAHHNMVWVSTFKKRQHSLSSDWTMIFIFLSPQLGVASSSNIRVPTAKLASDCIDRWTSLSTPILFLLSFYQVGLLRPISLLSCRGRKWKASAGDRETYRGRASCFNFE
jgi:hypothetical protein